MKKEIGSTVSISRENDETLVKIVSPLERWQAISLLVWLVIWTSMGIYVVYYLVNAPVEDEQLIFFIVYLAFWFYFEFHALRAYLFKTFGYELIKIANGKLLYKRSLFGTGRVKQYALDNIERFKLREYSRRSFSDAYIRSFWTLSNERISFDYLNGKGVFGMHLPDRDAEKLLQFLNKNHWCPVKKEKTG